jgi:RNA polymerase sigma-70 factor (ECF subfamily)
VSDTLRLLEEARRGDSRAFQRLFERHRARLAALAYARMSPGLRGWLEAEDVVQETWIEATKKLSDFEAKGPNAFYRWLATIAGFKVREAERNRRARKRGQPGPLPTDPPGGTTSVPRRMERSESAARVVEALDELPEAQAEAVRLRYLEGLGVAETAERLGRSEAAVKALVGRGLTALGARLVEPP